MEFNYFAGMLREEAEEAHMRWLDAEADSAEGALAFERWQMYLRLAQLASEAILSAEAAALRAQLTQTRQ